MFAALYIEDRDDNPDRPFKLSNFLSAKMTEDKEEETSAQGPKIATEDPDIKKVMEEAKAKAEAEAAAGKKEDEEEEDYGNFKTTPEEEAQYAEWERKKQKGREYEKFMDKEMEEFHKWWEEKKKTDPKEFPDVPKDMDL